MKHFSGQASRDRSQIALHILALAHAAIERRKPSSHTCGMNCKAIAALPALAAPDLPAWIAINPFRPSGANADPSNPSVPAHPARQSDLMTASPQGSSAIAIAIAGARATPRGCPALRRQLKGRGGCVQLVAGRPIPMVLKTSQSALHSSNVLSILSARPRPPREPSCWLEEPDPAAAVAAGMRRWQGCVPAGWLGLLTPTEN